MEERNEKIGHENARTADGGKRLRQTEASQSCFYYKTTPAAPSCPFLASNTTLPGSVFLLSLLGPCPAFNCQLHRWASWARLVVTVDPLFRDVGANHVQL